MYVIRQIKVKDTEKNNIPSPFVTEKVMAGRAWVEVFIFAS